MNPNREFIGNSKPLAVFHTNVNTAFACIPIDETNPLTDFKIMTNGDHIISAANLRRVANDILRMLGEGW
tara:strand:+ start:491 stop:700 length:210 start_codon:yes stop_codon:yes gene_type:complete